MSIPIFYPIPQTRRGIRILMLILAAVCAGLAAIALFYWSSAKNSLEENGQPDFNGLAQEELKGGLLVRGDISLAIDYYAEDYETNFGIRTSDDSEALYYLIPIYDPSPDGSINIRYFITYQAGPKDFGALDDAVAQMWSTDPIAAQLTLDNAEITKLPATISGLLDEWAGQVQFYEGGSFIDWCAEYYVFGTDDPQAIAARLTPYMIRRASPAGTTMTLAIVFAGLAVTFLALFLILTLVQKPIRVIPDGPPPSGREPGAERTAQPEGERHDDSSG